MSEESIIGRLLCPRCSHIKNAVGREGTLWVLECGHKIVKLGFTHPEEFVTEFYAPRLSEEEFAELSEIVGAA